MTKPKKPDVTPTDQSAKSGADPNNIATPSDHYQREKGKRARRQPPENELMAQARREYNALLEAQAAKGKGGRPKKSAARPDPDRAEDSSTDD